MANTTLEALMRQGERLHLQRLPSDEWLIVRVDGHGFSRLTSTHFQKLFDPAFHQCML
jgi:tRNA(His) 5'-end guanylyltransferase